MTRFRCFVLMSCLYFTQIVPTNADPLLTLAECGSLPANSNFVNISESHFKNHFCRTEGTDAGLEATIIKDGKPILPISANYSKTEIDCGSETRDDFDYTQKVSEVLSTNKATEILACGISACRLARLGQDEAANIIANACAPTANLRKKKEEIATFYNSKTKSHQIIKVAKSDQKKESTITIPINAGITKVFVQFIQVFNEKERQLSLFFCNSIGDNLKKKIVANHKTGSGVKPEGIPCFESTNAIDKETTKFLVIPVKIPTLKNIGTSVPLKIIVGIATDSADAIGTQFVSTVGYVRDAPRGNFRSCVEFNNRDECTRCLFVVHRHSSVALSNGGTQRLFECHGLPNNSWVSASFAGVLGQEFKLGNNNISHTFELSIQSEIENRNHTEPIDLRKTSDVTENLLRRTSTRSVKASSRTPVTAGIAWRHCSGENPNLENEQTVETTCIVSNAIVEVRVEHDN